MSDTKTAKMPAILRYRKSRVLSYDDLCRVVESHEMRLYSYSQIARLLRIWGFVSDRTHKPWVAGTVAKAQGYEWSRTQIGLRQRTPAEIEAWDRRRKATIDKTSRRKPAKRATRRATRNDREFDLLRAAIDALEPRDRRELRKALREVAITTAARALGSKR